MFRDEARRFIEFSIGMFYKRAYHVCFDKQEGSSN